MSHEESLEGNEGGEEGGWKHNQSCGWGQGALGARDGDWVVEAP